MVYKFRWGVISKVLIPPQFYDSNLGTTHIPTEWHIQFKSRFPHKKHQATITIKATFVAPMVKDYYPPPSWMTIEFTVASEVRRNKSPSLITTFFAESCPGSQFLRRGFWSGQFSIKQHSIDIPSNPSKSKSTSSQIQALLSLKKRSPSKVLKHLDFVPLG